MTKMSMIPHHQAQEHIALIDRMSNSTGQENVKSQLEEQSWSEQQKVRVRGKNKV